MSMKRYIAKTNIAINIVLESGKSKHVSFLSMTNSNKSYYYTDDEDVQKGLEKHYKYGKMFSEDKTYVTPTEEQSAGDVDPTPVPNGKKQIHISDFEDAKDYLAEKFGIARSKIRSLAAVLKAAEANGIEFVGLGQKNDENTDENTDESGDDNNGQGGDDDANGENDE